MKLGDLEDDVQWNIAGGGRHAEDLRFKHPTQMDWQPSWLWREKACYNIDPEVAAFEDENGKRKREETENGRKDIVEMLDFYEEHWLDEDPPDWEAARSSRVDGQQTQDDGLNDREQAAMSSRAESICREGGLEEGPKLGRRRLRRKQAPPLGW